MKATKPILHGRDHLGGGADPIPALMPPSGKVDEIILATFPGAYYKMNETTGVWADSSGGGRDAVYTGLGSRGIPAPLDENDGALCAHVDGEVPGTSSTPAAAVGVATDSMFEFGGVVPFTVSALIRPDIVPVDESNWSMGVCGNVTTTSGGAQGWGLFILSHAADPDAATLYAGVPARVCFRRSGAGGTKQQATGRQIGTGSWLRVTGVFDGTTMGLWLDASQVASGSGSVSLPSGSSWRSFRIGDCGIAEGFGGNLAPYNGLIDSVIVWDRALTSDELDAIVGTDPTDPVPSSGGQVLTSDGAGGTSWQPPGVEVTHGAGTPDETPGPGPPPSEFVGTPTNPSGWHIQAHTETAVLYDSTPGRFDVPTMKWVRVPFNTVRILRTWETSVDGPTKTAWLPEDRGLTEAAKDGLLLITAGMVATPGNLQFLRGFFSIEYPVVDYAKLPDDDVPIEHGPIVGFDEYVRGARLFQPQSGVVTRVSPGDTVRAMISWGFPDDANEGIRDGYTSDNPFPIYPPNWGHWTRPLHLPQPYPAFSPTESRSYYLISETGYPPFGEVVTLTANADLAAGATICLQAWQDTPYTLRFSTDHFPNYLALAIDPPYGTRPYLSISYLYDPDDIDHTSGKRNPGS